MQMILWFHTGQRMDGLLLKASPDSMRIAVRSPNETIELHCEDGRWMSEDGATVEIESVIWDGRTAIPAFRGETAERTLAAGR